MSKTDNFKGKGNTKGFSTTNQPSSKTKSNGKSKKKLLKDIASQLVGNTLTASNKELAEYLGVDVENIDIETLMHLKQIERAIKESDTRAYIAIMDRLKGKPKQEVEQSTKDKPKHLIIKVNRN